MVFNAVMPKMHIPYRAVKSLFSHSYLIDGNLFIEIFDQV